MSRGVNSASERPTFCWFSVFSIWTETVSAEVICSGFSSGVPRLTAMMMSAPIERAMSTGRLRTNPPSTS